MSLREKLEATPISSSLYGPIPCDIDHPDWPKQVFVRKMYGPERRKYDAFAYELSGASENADVDTMWAMHPFLVCLCLTGPDGKRLFSDGDEKWIEENLPGDLISEASRVAIDKNGLSQRAVIDEQKNSASGTQSDS